MNAFDYQSDFDRLWESREPAGDCVLNWWEHHIDPEMGAITSYRFLTPLEWAACVAAECESEGRKAPRIVVCVPEPHRLRVENLPSWKFKETIMADSQGWLRVVTEEADSITEETFEKLFADTKSEVTPKQWLNWVWMEMQQGGGEDNHALANAVGPLLLMGHELKEPSSHQKALLRLFRTMGVLTERTTEEAPEHPLPVVRGQRWVLVDDQARQGWDRWLEIKAAKCGAELVVVDSPSDFVGLLQRVRERVQAARQQRNADCRFSLRLLADTPANTMEVVFLDLRLFSKSVQSKREFYSLLSELCTAFGHACGHESQLAFPAFSEGELQLIGKLVQGAADPKLERRCLTFLARVLALADLSLPVIVFSSTDRREVMASLSSFPTVFTSLRKNVLRVASDYDANDELHRILEMVKDRQKWRERLAPLVTSKAKGVSWPVQGFAHFEIYVDESSVVESGNFCVGAVLVGYRDEPEAQEIHDKMTAQGLRWVKADGEVESLDYIAGQTEYLKKVRNEGGGTLATNQWESVAGPIEALLGDRPVVPVVLFRDPGNYHSAAASVQQDASLAKDFAQDNLFLGMLQEVLEIVLHDVLRPFTWAQSGWTLNIYPAARFRVIADGLDEASAIQTIDVLRERYARQGIPLEGAKDNQGQWSVRFSTFHSGDFVAMGTQLLSVRAPSPHTRALAEADVAIHAVNLVRRREVNGQTSFNRVQTTAGWAIYENINCGSFRHLHELADLLAHFAKGYGLGEMESWQPYRGTAGLVAARNQDFRDLLHAARHLDACNAVEALLVAPNISYLSKMRGLWVDVMEARLQGAAKGLRGVEFLRLVSGRAHYQPSPPRLLNT